MKKQVVLLVSIVLLAGLPLTGCGALSAYAQEAATTVDSVSPMATSGNAIEVAEPDWSVYAPFGLTYDAKTDQLTFEGQRVRWFQDYWPIDEYGAAGWDHLDEGGTVDLYAVRDLTVKKVNDDGSYDPSGVVSGLAAFSQEAFDKRDIEALKNPKITEACSSERPATPEELSELYAVYAPYGLAYDMAEDCLYYQEKKVGYFLDILASNGAEPGSGDFHGALRSTGNEGGAISVRAIRDYSKTDANGYGTLMGVERFESEA